MLLLVGTAKLASSYKVTMIKLMMKRREAVRMLACTKNTPEMKVICHL